MSSLSEVPRSDTVLRGAVRRQRGRRLLGGLHSLVALTVMGAIVVVVNLIAAHFSPRWSVSDRARHELSPKTHQVLAMAPAPVQVYALMERDSLYATEVRHLLLAYRDSAAASGVDLQLTVVDPTLDLAKIRRLASTLDLEESRVEEVVVFACQGRHQYVDMSDLIASEVDLSNAGQGYYKRREIGFRGEQLFTSALLSVINEARPTVYFLAGHGERDPVNFDAKAGYSSIARLIDRENMRVMKLALIGSQNIPDDCDVLVIAGPRTRLAQREVDEIDAYLQKAGARAMLLLDPEIVTGLEPLLARWKIELGDGIVVERQQPYVALLEYGQHPLTRRLKGLMTVFVMPRPVFGVAPEASNESGAQTVVVPILTSSEQSWQELDLTQDPPHYDEGRDRHGATSFGVAAERGTAGVELQLAPARMAVIGDSSFVKNNMLDSGVGGNANLFMALLNWLVDRDDLVAIAPRPPHRLVVGMSRDVRSRLLWLLGVGVPGVFALAGVLVWWRRRH